VSATSNSSAGSRSGDDVVLLDVSERIATITFNRPEARNALSSEVLRLLPQLMAEADADDAVDVIILTGKDPSFSAGLDLKELGSSAGNLGSTRRVGEQAVYGPWAQTLKPVIGAINGFAITGGFEIALFCDFLVASERARFGDTHARVGVMPGWGLTVMLQQAIGVRRAREMSFTGNFLTADEAFHWGLVNHVVPHADLIPFTRKLALDMIGNDQDGVRQVRATYQSVAMTTVREGWQVEQRDSLAWQQRAFSRDEVARRRAGILERGRSQG